MKIKRIVYLFLLATSLNLFSMPVENYAADPEEPFDRKEGMPFIKLGKAVRYDKDKVQEWLYKRTQK